MLLMTDNANESVLSLVKEASTASADSSFDMMSSVIPGYQPPSRKLTTPFSPGRKTPELFTPSSKSLMVLNAAAVILCSVLYGTMYLVCNVEASPLHLTKKQTDEGTSWVFTPPKPLRQS